MEAQVISLFGSHHGHDRRQPQAEITLVAHGAATTGYTHCGQEQAVEDLVRSGWTEVARGVLVLGEHVAVVRSLA